MDIAVDVDQWHRLSACELGAAIGRGDIDARALCDHFLDRIELFDPEHRIYLRTTPARARAEAKAAWQRARDGLRRGILDGVPISWKDLYDSAGVPTEMGSPLLAGRVPEHDALVLARASRAGLVCLGKTNTVEFALGGIGLNRYTGTPANAVLRDVPRAPGGSSCGAAVSVASGLAAAGIGSDTGGSVRIPAAWNRLVGLKTSVGLLPTDGVLPLAPSLDTVGPLTRSVADAAELLAVMAADKPVDLTGATLKGSIFLVAETVVWDSAEPAIADSVKRAISRLQASGARIAWAPVPEFTELEDLLDRQGAIVTAEGYATWQGLIESGGERIDPVVLDRFRQGKDLSGVALEAVRAGARAIAARLYQRLAGYDALLAPTVPIAPPPLAEVEATLENYRKANMATLRNTRLGNVLPCCALTLPCPDGPIPAGLMLMAAAGEDRRLLRVGRAAEIALQ